MTAFITLVLLHGLYLKQMTRCITDNNNKHIQARLKSMMSGWMSDAEDKKEREMKGMLFSADCRRAFKGQQL